MTLGGTPLVTHAVRRLVATGGVSHVVVVVPASHEDEFADVLSDFADGDVPVEIVAGGAERSDSVRCGLRALDRECDIVLVHDAARCLAPVELTERVLAALAAGADAVIPVVPVVDTIKVVEATETAGDDGEDDGRSAEGGAEDAPALERVVSTPVRADLRAVQTPQGFRRSVLVAAHESGLDATDDAALIERAGGEVLVVDGDLFALKVTTPLDIVVAEHLLADRSEAEPV